MEEDGIVSMSDYLDVQLSYSEVTYSQDDVDIPPINSDDLKCNQLEIITPDVSDAIKSEHGDYKCIKVEDVVPDTIMEKEKTPPADKSKKNEGAESGSSSRSCKTTEYIRNCCSVVKYTSLNTDRTKIEFSVTKKGKECIYYGDYCYQIVSSIKTGRSYWRCSNFYKLQCNASIITEERQLVKSVSEHCCNQDSSTKANSMFKVHLKKRAKEELPPLPEIYKQECIRTFIDDGAPIVAKVPRFDGVKTSMLVSRHEAIPTLPENQNGTKMEFSVTIRGKECIYYGGYCYQKVRSGKKGRSYYRCSNYYKLQCNAGIITEERQLVKSDSEHCCKCCNQDESTKVNSMFKVRLKERAKEELTPLPEIYKQECIRTFIDDGAPIAAKLPRYDGVKTSMLKSRHNAIPTLPESQNVILLPDVLIK